MLSDGCKLLRRWFLNDVENIAESLIELYGLKYEKETQSLSSALLRWLDFRLRYVEPKPRKVVLSDKCLELSLPPKVEASLRYFVRLVESGWDVNPYQGRGLIQTHDTSSKRRGQRTDLLWAHWGILHFHITNKEIPQGQYFSCREAYQAFCLVDDGQIRIIDVREHPKAEGFADDDLLKIAHRNWPDYFDTRELKSVLLDPDFRNMGREDVYKLRRSGIDSFYSINGKAYFGLGGGVTTASTSSLVSHKFFVAKRLISSLADDVYKRKELLNGCSLEVRNVSVVISYYGLIAYDKKSGGALVKNQDLSDLIVPNWVMGRIISSRLGMCKEAVLPPFRKRFHFFEF